MANLFKSIPKPKLRRNTFNLSHEVKFTTDFGVLTPILCEPVVPGDTWRMNTEILIRVAPLLAPVMHRVNIYTHFFFVPCRLLWSNWTKFITGGESGTEEPAYPKIALRPANVSLMQPGSLSDYLGFPSVSNENTLQQNDMIYWDALPFRAYQLIYNEYYRDENLSDEIDIKKDVDGVIDDQIYLRDIMRLRLRSWEKDYFTSALPFTQRGAETTIGLTGNATVNPNYQDERLQVRFQGLNDGGYGPQDLEAVPLSDSSPWHEIHTKASGNPLTRTNLEANLSSVNATTINELRRAMNLQRYKEVLARSGSRYIELIRGLFGVVSSDARLQRPEFLGGGKTSMQFGEVLQTSETTKESPLANMAGRGVSYGKGHSFKRFFEEHGYIIGIMSVMPKPAYQDGMPRKFYKFDRLDHYIPQFANIGEQDILNQELHYNFSDANAPIKNADTFGYTPRYAEYKYLPSSVHGDFKSSLDFWHMGREFTRTPRLNDSFVQMFASEVSRVFAVQDTQYQHLWCMLYHNIRATRPMPKFGVPLI